MDEYERQQRIMVRIGVDLCKKLQDDIVLLFAMEDKVTSVSLVAFFQRKENESELRGELTDKWWKYEYEMGICRVFQIMMNLSPPKQRWSLSEITDMMQVYIEVLKDERDTKQRYYYSKFSNN